MTCHSKTKVVIAANARGFTLIELAVALFIITLVLASILVPLTSQVEQRQISDTRKTLEEIKEALIGFAIANGYLPCPAISAIDGHEDRNGTVCRAGKRDGYIPWATLGVSKLDAWGHIFRYSVAPAYASSNPLFGLISPRTLMVQTRDAAGALSPLTNLNDIPAVALSHGKNGYGSVNDQGTPQANPADWPLSNLDESTNVAVNTTTFVSRAPQAAGLPGPGGEFDDIVVWISPNILFNRMVAAGKLP
jgi:prepilin-type N-terminal cleavage/methylation domain-containing protein